MTFAFSPFSRIQIAQSSISPRQIRVGLPPNSIVRPFHTSCGEKTYAGIVSCTSSLPRVFQ
jgi:hypothetical protein